MLFWSGDRNTEGSRTAVEATYGSRGTPGIAPWLGKSTRTGQGLALGREIDNFLE